MVWHRWAAMALCIASLVAAQRQLSARLISSPLAFKSISGERYSQLRRQAIQFGEARPRQGFQFVETHRGASLQIHCKGVPVLWLERQPKHLAMWVSQDAEQRAPDVLPLRALLEQQLEPLDYLEQTLAGVPEPVLMDWVLLAIAGDVPRDARCAGER